jgi:hypothetical protein
MGYILSTMVFLFVSLVVVLTHAVSFEQQSQGQGRLLSHVVCWGIRRYHISQYDKSWKGKLILIDPSDGICCRRRLESGRTAHGSWSPTSSPSLAARYATNSTSNSSPEFASHLAAYTTPDVISNSFANAQTVFIAYYKGGDASDFNGLWYQRKSK